MSALLNKKGKPFTWSYSAISEFETCPSQYAAKRFYCTTVEAETEQMIWGTRVHKALEERIRDGKPLPEGMENCEPWAAALEKVPGEKFFELQFAVNDRLEICDWYAKNAYGRGVADLLIYNKERREAVIIDYKTGKKKDDPTQLKLFCWFALKVFPDIETFKYRYIWLKVKDVTKGEISRHDTLGMFGEIVGRIKRMEQAWREENFPCNPSGLCHGWCAVSECIHWRGKR